MTLETKPQRRNQHTVLCHMAGLQPGGYMVSASGRAEPQVPGTRADSAGGCGKPCRMNRDVPRHSLTHRLSHRCIDSLDTFFSESQAKDCSTKKIRCGPCLQEAHVKWKELYREPSAADHVIANVIAVAAVY